MSPDAQLFMGITWGIVLASMAYCVWRLGQRRH